MNRFLSTLGVFALVFVGSAPALLAQGESNITVFGGQADRKSSRVLFWERGAGPKGQVCVTWGPVAWKDTYAQAIDGDAMVGKRWRFGGDYWTMLETQFDITIAGVELKAGQHFLTLVKTASGDIHMHVLDPVECRKKKLDPFVADRAEKATAVPLKLEKSEKPAKMLDLHIVKGEKDITKMTFKVAFGPHVLTAPISVKMK